MNLEKSRPKDALSLSDHFLGTAMTQKPLWSLSSQKLKTQLYQIRTRRTTFKSRSSVQ